MALRPAGAGDALPCSDPGARKAALKVSQVLPIASSPYATRRDSAFLDAALIDVLVEEAAAFSLSDGTRPCALAPGSELAVSSPLGCGFASLFSSAVGLSSCLESGRPLLLLGGGAFGAAALRSVLEWQPVAAHAGVHAVSLFLACPSAAAAPYVSEWDRWREAGVTVFPCFEHPVSGGTTSQLEETLLRGGRRMGELLGGTRPQDAAVLIAGLRPDVRARVTKELVAAGFDNENFLFCEP